MKLGEIIETGKGTYAAVRFDNETVKNLKRYVKENGIPNPNTDWHTTLLYSRKHLVNYKPTKKYATMMEGVAKDFELYDDGKVLALNFSCPPLYQRHHKLMLEHGATYDYDQYRPHVTLSYDASNVNIDELPEIDFPIRIVGEYSEDLELDK